MYKERLIINDVRKNQYCFKNHIKLIRIPYTEFNNIELILNIEFERGFDRSLDLSQQLHNKFNSNVSIVNEQII